MEEKNTIFKCTARHRYVAMGESSRISYVAFFLALALNAECRSQNGNRYSLA